jgi:hypothetical protein
MVRAITYITLTLCALFSLVIVAYNLAMNWIIEQKRPLTGTAYCVTL